VTVCCGKEIHASFRKATLPYPAVKGVWLEPNRQFATILSMWTLFLLCHKVWN
jgi:hypothetical protein